MTAASTPQLEGSNTQLTIYIGFRTLWNFMQYSDHEAPIHALSITDTTNGDHGIDIQTTRIVISQYLRDEDSVIYCRFVTARRTFVAGVPVEPDSEERHQRALAAWRTVVDFLTAFNIEPFPATIAIPKDLVLLDGNGPEIIDRARAYMAELNALEKQRTDTYVCPRCLGTGSLTGQDICPLCDGAGKTTHRPEEYAGPVGV